MQKQQGEVHIDRTFSLDQLIQSIDIIRNALHADMPVQTILVFLHVARWPGITMKELAQRLNMAQATMSRNVALLGRYYRQGSGGHDVIEATEDPLARHRKNCYLTPKGQLLINQLKQLGLRV